MEVLAVFERKDDYGKWNEPPPTEDSIDLQSDQASTYSESTVRRNLPLWRRKCVFALLVLINVFLTYDSGAVAASLRELQVKFNMSSSTAGLIGSLVYLGLTAGSLLAGPLLTHTQPKWVLVCSLILNMACAITFAAASITPVLLVARFFMGMSQAFISIYAPVWVDEFSPPKSCTFWMSLIQGGVPIGIVVGYVCSGYLTANGFEVSVPFYMQAVFLLPLTIGLCCVPVAFIDTRVSTTLRHDKRPINDVLQDVTDTTEKHPPRVDILTQEKGREMWGHTKILIGRKPYVFTTLALCSLFFVVTGLQLWVTDYLVTYINVGKNAVVTAFSFTCATGPILGVLVGGLILDRLGGYQGTKGVYVACRMSTLTGILAVCCAYAIIFVQNFGAVVTFIWLLLAFGGAIVPAGTGIIMSSVPRELRSLASSLSTVTYNLFGYFSGPTVAGIVADSLGGTQWGFRIVMAWSLFSAMFFGFAWFYALRDVDFGSELSYDHPMDELVATPKEANSLGYTDLAYEAARNQKTVFIPPITTTSPDVSPSVHHHLPHLPGHSPCSPLPSNSEGSRLLHGYV